jgi:hypothetical protein
MEIPLFWTNKDNSTFLQKIFLNTCAFNRVALLKKEPHKLPKTTGILISDGFAIAKCLEDRVASQYFPLNRIAPLAAQTCEHLHAIFCRLSFSCSRLSRNNNCLFFLSP